MYRLLYFAVLLFVSLGVNAQILTERSELVATYGSGNFAPMWHSTYKQGINSEKNNSVYARLGASGEHLFSNIDLNLDWGVDAVAGYNLASTVFVQQAYFDIRWRRVKLSLGQKERWCDMKNPRLSTGALIES